MAGSSPACSRAVTAELLDETAAAARLAAARAALARGDALAARSAARAARGALLAGPAGASAVAEAWVIEAVASNILFDHLAAFECAMEAEALLEPRDVALHLRVLNVRFLANAESGNLARALDFSHRSVALAEVAGDRYGAARALHNRGILLNYLGEFEAAQECLRDVVARFEALPDQQLNACFARVSLASACLKHARQLAHAGQAAAAQARRRSAEQALPGADAAAPAVPGLAELTVLGLWVVLLSEVGRLAEARWRLRRCLAVLRLTGRAPRHQAYALAALAAYCFHSGRPDRGLRWQQAAVARLQQGASHLEQMEAQARLLQMHEARGDHAQALAGLRAVRAERVRLAVDQARLSCRLAAVERQVRLRQAAQREAQVHMQRLAVVGRLMADIHHALDRPLTQVQQALAVCAATATSGLQEQALLQVVGHVEAAAGLVRQLRMFSYRAAPQPMVVNLQDSLREAWDGVALRRRGAARQLRVTGDPLMQVRADVQRLAVLLRILLIEVDQAWPEGALAAHLAQAPGGGCLQLCGMAAARGAGPAGVGLTLCREIAEELAGALTHGRTAAGGAALLLELPLG
jgi:signal transduction histidine kinase